MTLHDPQHGEKLEKCVGIRASFVPTHHPYASPCSNGDASAATAGLLWELPANKGSIVASYEYIQTQREGSRVRQPFLSNSGSDRTVTPTFEGTFFPSFWQTCSQTKAIYTRTGSWSHYKAHKRTNRESVLGA